MPEYLAPGVYVEEVSFRAKSIEGVSTTVTGFVGPTRYGPIQGEPEVLTSALDFQRIYGGFYNLEFVNLDDPVPNYMAHAVRSFFDNGGSKLYVTRVFEPAVGGDDGRARQAIGAAGAGFQGIRARFPGQAGNMRVVFAVRVSPNLLMADPAAPLDPTRVRVSGIQENDVVYITESLPGVLPARPAAFFDVVRQNDALVFRQTPTSATIRAQVLGLPPLVGIHLITVTVSIRMPGRFEEEISLGDFALHPRGRNALLSYFTERPESRRWALASPFAIVPPGGDARQSGAALANWLLGAGVLDAIMRSVLPASGPMIASLIPPRPLPNELQVTYQLAGGNDGRLPTAERYTGGEDSEGNKTGMVTFEDLEEISIVAAPGYSAKHGPTQADDQRRAAQITQSLLSHVERMRYRVAVLDAPDDDTVGEVRGFRGQFDSKYAALYYPWVRVLDPLDPDGRRELNLPPSGFVTGIYARNDVENGVFKAPANEVVRGAIRFETLLNKAQQDILNPDGVNCFRFFEGRGYRLWGARTISSDPEWKYLNVRRYFAYLEHSVDRGTQWVVFQNNGPALWANVRRTVDDFLFNEWRSGALLGTKPEEAYFVRCDRSTMTQNDLDNGRLICLVGVAVVKPAEFVIFRIGQWTADRPA